MVTAETELGANRVALIRPELFKPLIPGVAEAGDTYIVGNYFSEVIPTKVLQADSKGFSYSGAYKGKTVFSGRIEYEKHDASGLLIKLKDGQVTFFAQERFLNILNENNLKS